MYKIGFEPEAEKEFLALQDKDRALVAKKIITLQKGRFQKDKPLKGRHKGKFRKRAGNFRIIYLKACIPENYNEAGGSTPIFL